MYDDDIVLIADNEHDLQCMLDLLYDWSKANYICVNSNKSNIVHVRPKSFPKSAHTFVCGDTSLTTIDKYTYLGLVLNEYLDFNVTAKMVAQSAGRALGLIIAKSKYIGGMSHDVFAKLYDSIGWPAIASFSCIGAVHNRAIQLFIGVGKYTPIAAVSGDMA